MTQTTEILDSLWIDDDGFIASGSGDTYLTVADCDCNHLDIDEREQIKDEIVKRCNQFPKLKKQNAEYIEALRLALPYVQGAYECAFPDQEENDYVSEKIKSLTNDKTT